MGHYDEQREENDRKYPNGGRIHDTHRPTVESQWTPNQLNQTKAEAARPGENMKVGGAKMDVGKAEIFAGLVDYFPRALNEVALVSDYGAQKYSRGGWRTLPDAYVRYGNSLGRHYFASATGDYDTGPAGSDLLHDAQVAWNALARLEIGLRDGRYLSTPGRKLVKTPMAVEVEKSAAAAVDFKEFEKQVARDGLAQTPASEKARIPTYMDNLVKALEAIDGGQRIRVVQAPFYGSTPSRTRNRFAEYYYYGVDPLQHRWIGMDFGSEEAAKPACQKLKAAAKQAVKKASKARRGSGRKA